MKQKIFSKNRLLVTLLAAALVLTGGAAHATTKPHTVATATPITFAVAGDSFSAIAGNWTTLQQTSDVKMVANWSLGGATCGQILNRVQPIDVDVLIVECGNNDANQHLNWATMVNNAEAIAKKVGARHVIISAVGPSNITDNGSGINRRDANQNASKYLASMANNDGYFSVDPFTSLKNWDNSYVSGMNASDNVHPSALGFDNMQKRYDEFILQAVNGAGPA